MTTNTTPPTPDNSSPTPKKWWRWLGIKPHTHRFFRFKPTLWGYCLLFLLASIIGMAAFAEYSMQPDFCRSCHLMEPYYQAWHQSSHKNVNCVLCHFEPGLNNTLYGKFQASSQAAKFITGTYGSKPHAEIRDASCMRSGCHEQRLLEGKVAWKIPTQRGGEVTIRFDHTPHLTDLRRGKQLRCVSCHSQIVQGQHLVVTLDTCFLCHFKGFSHGREDQTLGTCRACHDAPAQTIHLPTGNFNHATYINRGIKCQNCHADAVAGDGAVPKQVCWTCHNQPNQIAKYSQTALLHKEHITDHKVECSSCHVQIRHSLEAAAAGDPSQLHGTGQLLALPGGCAQCHSSMHNGALTLYRGSGGRGVPNMPNPMFQTRVDCIACHSNPSQNPDSAKITGQTFSASPQACVQCHGDSRYASILADWKSSAALRLFQAQTIFQQAQQHLAAATNLTDTTQLQLQQLLDDARHNISLVQLGHAVHNMPYSLALLSAASDNAATILKQLHQPIPTFTPITPASTDTQPTTPPNP